MRFWCVQNSLEAKGNKGDRWGNVGEEEVKGSKLKVECEERAEGAPGAAVNSEWQGEFWRWSRRNITTHAIID